MTVTIKSARWLLISQIYAYYYLGRVAMPNSNFSKQYVVPIAYFQKIRNLYSKSKFIDRAI